MADVVYRSAVLSLVVQLLIGGVTTAAFFLPVRDAGKREDLRVILLLELSSQIVELLWYFIVVCRYGAIRTWTRYADWVVSTPVMLASTVLFFQHRRGRPLSDVPTMPALWISVGLDWVMLLFGFLAEREVVPLPLGLAFGSAAFVGSFAALAVPLDGADGVSSALYGVMYAVWALYGVAAALPYAPKNVGYNLLDVVSKNCYGLFLFVYSVTG